MTITYSIPEDANGNPSTTLIQRNNEDGSVSFLTVDPANADYQAYLNKDTLPSNSSIPQAGE